MGKTKWTKLTTYVEFLHPGIFMSEESVKKVKSRDVLELKVPKTAFAFKFFGIKSTIVDGIKLTSERLNISPTYFFGGRIMTLDEVCKELPDARTLISNMKCNHWDRIIRCRTGNFQPFIKGFIFIDPEQRKSQIVA